MGRSSTGDNYIYLWEALSLSEELRPARGRQHPRPDAGGRRPTADFLIERKQAGQFRNFWKIFDDQVADMKNGEVDAIRCWEPAVREANKAGGDWVYANAKEFFLKWMHAATSRGPGAGPRQSRRRARRAELDLERRATRRPSRRSRLCLGPARSRQAVRRRERRAQGRRRHGPLAKNVKFAKEDFWFNAVPTHLQEMQAQMDRVLNA